MGSDSARLKVENVYHYLPLSTIIYHFVEKFLENWRFSSANSRGFSSNLDFANSEKSTLGNVLHNELLLNLIIIQ